MNLLIYTATILCEEKHSACAKNCAPKRIFISSLNGFTYPNQHFPAAPVSPKSIGHSTQNNFFIFRYILAVKLVFGPRLTPFTGSGDHNTAGYIALHVNKRRACIDRKGRQIGAVVYLFKAVHHGTSLNANLSAFARTSGFARIKRDGASKRSSPVYWLPDQTRHNRLSRDMLHQL